MGWMLSPSVRVGVASRVRRVAPRDSGIWNLDSVDYSDLRLDDDEAVVLCSSRN